MTTSETPQDQPMAAETRRALKLAGAPTGAVHLYPTGGHGFGLCANWQPVGGFQACCEWPLSAQRFLQQHGWALGWPTNITAF